MIEDYTEKELHVLNKMLFLEAGSVLTVEDSSLVLREDSFGVKSEERFDLFSRGKLLGYPNRSDVLRLYPSFGAIVLTLDIPFDTLPLFTNHPRLLVTSIVSYRLSIGK
jgi:hypothetical protein